MSEEIEKKDSGLKPISEIKLVNRCLRSRWPITDEHKKEAVETIMEAMRCDDSNAKLRAVKAMIDADKINQEDDHLEEKNKRLDEGKPTEAVQFKAFLGIDPGKV